MNSYANLAHEPRKPCAIPPLELRSFWGGAIRALVQAVTPVTLADLYHPGHAVSLAARARATVAMRRRVDALAATVAAHVTPKGYVHGALSEALVSAAEAAVVEAWWERP